MFYNIHGKLGSLLSKVHDSFDKNCVLNFAVVVNSSISHSSGDLVDEKIVSLQMETICQIMPSFFKAVLSRF